jgi:hypothetical protein
LAAALTAVAAALSAVVAALSAVVAALSAVARFLAARRFLSLGFPPARRFLSPGFAPALVPPKALRGVSGAPLPRIWLFPAASRSRQRSIRTRLLAGFGQARRQNLHDFWRTKWVA